MPFIDRNPDSSVKSYYANAQRLNHEYIDDDHVDMVVFRAARQAVIDAQTSDRASLRQQVQDETEAQWLARTDEARWKIILKLLKAIERRI